MTNYGFGQAQSKIRSAYEALVRQSNPLAYWRMGDASGPLVDEIAALNATVTGSPTFGAASALLYDQDNGSVQWSGSGQFAQPSSNTFTFNNVLTIEAWVFPTVTTRQTIYGCNNAANQPQLEIGASNEVSAIVSGVFMATTVTGVITQNAWNHIVYTRNGTGATHAIYVNKVSRTLTTNNATGYTDGASVKIIAARASGSQLFTGKIDELAIYNTNFSSSVVSAHYDAARSAIQWGQAHAYIRVTTSNFAQAAARLIAIDIPASGQASAYIGHFQPAQATALIDSPHKQAYGQAQVILNQHLQTAQAQAKILVPSNEYENTIYSQIPLGYFPFDETSGTNFTNTIGTGDGTLLDAATLTFSINHPLANASGNVGIKFSPSVLSRISASVTGIPTATGSATTVTGWVKFASGGAGQMIFGWFVYDLFENSNNLGFNTGGGDNYGVNVSTLFDKWIHVVAVYYDNQNYTVANKIYINGIVQSLTQFSGGPTPRDVDVPFYFSGWGANGSEWARGTAMDAVALYGRELTATEIAQQYQAGLPRGYGQAQAVIAVGTRGVGQAQAYINHIGDQSAQAQARVISFDYPQFGQANADIVAASTRFGQANAVIKAQDGIVKIDLNSSGVNDGTYSDQRGPQQPNYDNTNASFGSEGLAFTAAFNADETGTWSFRIAVDDSGDFWISGTQIIDAGFLVRSGGEVNFDGTVSLISGNTYTFLARFFQNGGPFAFRAYYKRPSDIDWHFLTDNNPPWIQINANAGFGQSNAKIFSPVKVSGQANADILATTNKFGQAASDILATNNAFGQAHVWIASINVAGQAQTDIKATGRGYGQALAFVGHFQWGQAQAYLRTFGYPQAGQANADIKSINRSFGLALAAIDHGGHGQANADIKKVINSVGNVLAFILPPTFYGQAQAKIIAFNVTGSGQANADIHALVRRTGNAQAFITKRKGHGQAQAAIKNSRARGFGQALAKIGHLHSALAMAVILKSAGYGQAQTSIRRTFLQSGQAQAMIHHNRGYANAQASIVQIEFGIGQALAFIGAVWISQAQADIQQTYNKYAQAKAIIRQTGRGFGQANAHIRVRTMASGQAEAQIIGTRARIGQARVYIGHFARAQAQARIITFNTAHAGNAQAYIFANASVTPPSPSSDYGSYLVMFNGQKLPGYAQSESYDSTLKVNTVNSPYMDKSTSDIIGLTNKQIDLKMRLWESTYALCKVQVNRAATILRSSRKQFTKMYIQHLDKYYLAKASSIHIEKSVTESSRILDYDIELEVKPWLISNTVKMISGTGTISTDQVLRTLNDGGWTPPILTVTGTNVTVSGYTAFESAGYISISGAVNNLVINTESYTALEGTTDKSNIIHPLDGAIYVGPGKTTYEITGATDFTLEWQDRWYL